MCLSTIKLTNNNINWRYHKTYGSCEASPSSGTVNAGDSQQKTEVDCAFEADGQFNLTNAENGQSIGVVDDGYGECKVLSTVKPYVITTKLGYSGKALPCLIGIIKNSVN